MLAERRRCYFMIAYDIERFLQPQQQDYERALSEIRAGHKYSHWIWYIFPQLRGLGYSFKSRFYGIGNMKEARAYLAHPILHQHLLEISNALLELKEFNPTKVMGTPDDEKLRSSMTLFALAAPEEKIFHKILEKFYGGKKDEKTVHLLELRQKKYDMLGAIIGDIVGSRYEGHNHRSKDFQFFEPSCHYTDDSVMTLAISNAILMSHEDYSDLKEMAVKSMHEIGNIYPHAGYGRAFHKWLAEDNPQPYNSYGNGAAMRISPVAWVANSLEEVKMMSKSVTEVTHNHPEGVKGAEAVAIAIFLARQGKSQEEIRTYIENNYYSLDTSIARWHEINKFNSSCQGSVPQAITAFLEATDFEDAIRNAISIGGDSDTIAAMAGSIAEAYFGVPEDIREQAVTFLDKRLLTILTNFDDKYFASAK